MLKIRTADGWRSAHHTIELSDVEVAQPMNFAPDGGESHWKRGLEALRELVERAVAEQRRLTPVGSAWSLSEAIAPLEETWLVQTRALDDVPHVGLEPDWTEDSNPDRLVFTQAGEEISQLHVKLADHGLSLPTSGASSGQTVAGAVLTGTHGSALDYGGLPRCVRGVHMITGEGESLWLEPTEAPGVTEAWLDHIGAVRRRDDALFESALVSFGTFGICHGLLLEAEPIFLLERHREYRTIEDVLNHIRGGDAELEIDDDLLPAEAEALHHFELKLNPNPDADTGAVVETIFRRETPESYSYEHREPSTVEVASDTLDFAGRLLDRFGEAPVVGEMADATIERRVERTLARRYPETDGDPERGALGEVFPKVDVPPGGTSVEYAVDVGDTREAIRIALHALRSRDFAFPGLVGVRFVPESPATLGFTRFPMNCTIEVPSIAADVTTETLREVTRRLADDVELAMHWGQAIDWSVLDLTEMYDDRALETWREARRELTGSRDGGVFRNRLSDDAGLV